MKYTLLFFLLCTLILPAQALTVAVTHGQPMVDLATVYPAKCTHVDDSAKDPMCPYWEIALKVELEELIVSMENHDSRLSEDLHKDMLAIDDPALQATALNYTSNYRYDDPSYWDKAKDFLLGSTDLSLSAAAANYLKSSPNQIQIDLADRFFQSHPADGFIFNSDNIDATVQAATFNASLDILAQGVAGFTGPLTRLYLADTDGATSPNKISGIAYTAPGAQADLESQITAVAGLTPYAAKADLTAQENALIAQLQDLQTKLQNGDYSVIQQYQDTFAEYQNVSTQVSWYSTLGINNDNSKLWLKLDDQVPQDIVFAYTLEFDSVLDKSIVKYYSY